LLPRNCQQSNWLIESKHHVYVYWHIHGSIGRQVVHDLWPKDIAKPKAVKSWQEAKKGNAASVHQCAFAHKQRAFLHLASLCYALSKAGNANKARPVPN
jgi:hypothetical protein